MVETRGYDPPSEDEATPRRSGRRGSREHETPRKRHDRTTPSRTGVLRIQSVVNTTVELQLSGLSFIDPPSTPWTPGGRSRRIVSETPVEVSDSSPEADLRSPPKEERAYANKQGNTLRTHQSLSYTGTKNTRSATDGDMDVNSARSTVDGYTTRGRHAAPQRAEEESRLHTPLSSRSRYPASPSPLSVPAASPDRPRKSSRPLDTSAPASTCGKGAAQSSARPRYMQGSDRWQSSPTSTPPRSTDRNVFEAPEHRDDVFGSPSPYRSSHSTRYTDNVHTSRSSSGSSTLAAVDEMRGEWRRSELVDLFGYESEPDDGRYAKKAWYAVVRGQGHTGVYSSWEQVHQLTVSVSGSHQKGYHCKELAFAAYCNAVRRNAVRKLPGGGRTHA